MAGCYPALELLTGSRGQCRICLEDGCRNLKRPCLCSGSAAFVHSSCSVRWILESGQTSCPVCLEEMTVKFSPYSICSREVLRTWARSNRWYLIGLIFCFLWLCFVIPVACICANKGIQIGPNSHDTANAIVICSSAYSLLCLILITLLLLVIMCIEQLRRVRGEFGERPRPVGVRNRRVLNITETSV